MGYGSVGDEARSGKSSSASGQTSLGFASWSSNRSGLV